MFFKKWRSGVPRLRHSTTPGIPLGRYESGLEAVWAWQEHAHLLVIERENYGAGENLVATVFRSFKGPKVLIWPKGDCQWRESKDDELYTMGECLDELFALWIKLSDRVHRIVDGEDLPHMLVALPELHDAVSSDVQEACQFLYDLGRLLKHGREGRMHVMANIRQQYLYRACLPQEVRNQFPGLLVLGETHRFATQVLELPQTFDRPHGRLGDLGDGFWPLEVRLR
jgi:hypothetical protein